VPNFTFLGLCLGILAPIKQKKMQNLLTYCPTGAIPCSLAPLLDISEIYIIYVGFPSV